MATSFLGAMAPVATAGIIKIQSEQSCNVIGLDPSPAAAVGGVHCDTGDTPFDLTDLLNGTIGLFVGNSQTPSWNIVNDTGAPITSLTLFYSGALASNAFIDMQISGTGVFESCAETTSTNLTFSDAKCGTGDIAPQPVPLPLEMVWSGGSGIPVDGIFNIGTASFAHAGADAGCISGTPNCQPIATPEPGGLFLLATGLLASVSSRRRRP